MAQDIEGLKSYIADQIGTTKSRIDEFDGRLEEAITRVKGVPQEVADQLQLMRTRLESMEAAEAARVALPAGSGGGEIRRALEARGELRSGRLGSVEGIKLPGAIMRQVTTSARVPSQITYRDGVVEWTQDRASLIDRLATVPCTTDAYSFMRETRASGERGIHKTVNGPIAAATTTDVTFDDIGNIRVGDVAVFKRTDGAGTLLGYEEATVASFPGGLVVRFTANIVGDVADDDICSFRTYLATAEQATKPARVVEWDPISEAMKMIAIVAPLTKQALMYHSMLESYIQGRLARVNRENINWHCLYGTAAATQLRGFLSDAARQQYLWSTGGTGAGGDVVAAALGDSLADCIYKAALLIPDTGGLIECTMRRQDWQALAAEKGVDGQYIHGTTAPIAVVDTPTFKSVGPFPVHTEGQLAANGDFLLADHAKASELAVYGTGEFLWGYVDDQFRTNEITGRWEELLCHAILSYQHYVHGNFDSRPV